MAKRSSITSDTGIYRRVKHHADGQDITAAMESFFNGLRRFHNLTGHLERIEADAAAILKPHQPTRAELKQLKIKWQKLPPHVLRTGWENGLTDDERERVRDALDTLFTLVSLRRALKARDCEAVALWGMKLGTIIERVDVRVFEPLVMHEKKRRDGKRQAADERKLEVVRIYQELREQHPRSKKYKLVERIVGNTGYSAKAVWGYLKGILP